MEKVNESKARDLRQIFIDMAESGQGEGGDSSTFLRRFLPLPIHGRVLEPDCMLIIGHRGAGKSELFRALKTPGGPESIANVATRISAEDLQKIRWCVGYTTEGSSFPHPMLFQRFAVSRTSYDLQMVWLAYLLRALQDSKVDLPVDLPLDLFQSSPGPEPLFKLTEANVALFIEAIDKLNERLLADNQYVFVTYDELDRVSSSDWDTLAKIIQGLVQFWSANSRRWKRIRPKIFLRHDLYQKAAVVGPDVSKLSAQRLSLSWSVKDLYALFFKRLVNRERDAISEYFAKTLPVGEEKGAVGWVPTVRDESDFQPAIERLCGEFMGVSATKGRTFTWIPTHLQDAHGEVLPRSFVRLFEKAAEIEDQTGKAKWPQLIHHTCLRGALDKVSGDRIEELKEEFPWIDTVRRHLLQLGLKVPLERRELQDQLEINWSALPEPDRPPFRNSYDLVQFLGEFGLLYTRNDGRIDVRDIYLSGLGFKRKGGVQRPF